MNGEGPAAVERLPQLPLQSTNALSWRPGRRGNPRRDRAGCSWRITRLVVEVAPHAVDVGAVRGPGPMTRINGLSQAGPGCWQRFPGKSYQTENPLLVPPQI